MFPVSGDAWREICEIRGDETVSARSGVTGDQPSLNLILSLPSQVCEQVLEYLVSWLHLTTWRHEVGVWLYSLLVRLDKPLTPDVGSLLRDLVLICASLRRNIAADISGGDHDETVAALNLFICIVAKYFGQADLEDVPDE